MMLLKPKFWDYNKVSLFAILLFPITVYLKKILTKKNEFSLPVICIGNIYLGGTGKTPLSIELFSILKTLKKKPAFIRKKYSSFQDEINLLKKIGPVYENKKRSKAINEAIKNNFNVVILDDGFQDFSVKKNLSIVCFNEKQWIGNGLTIPSGPLRENMQSLNRANYVFINGGVKGIIVYHQGLNVYKTYDRNCSFEPSTQCAYIDSINSTIASCTASPKYGSLFLAFFFFVFCGIGIFSCFCIYNIFFRFKITR